MSEREKRRRKEERCILPTGCWTWPGVSQTANVDAPLKEISYSSMKTSILLQAGNLGVFANASFSKQVKYISVFKDKE